MLTWKKILQNLLFLLKLSYCPHALCWKTIFQIWKIMFDFTFQLVYPTTFRMVVKQLVKTEENGYRDVRTTLNIPWLKVLKITFNFAGFERSVPIQIHQHYSGLQQRHNWRSTNPSSTNWNDFWRSFLPLDKLRYSYCWYVWIQGKNYK